MGLVKRIGAGDLEEAAGTAGIYRSLAIADTGFWAGIPVTDPGVASGWHHHDHNHSLVFLVEGRMRIEWGAGGTDAVEATAGEFLYIGPGTVHREVNPEATPARVVVIRIGQGDPVVIAAGPE